MRQKSDLALNSITLQKYTLIGYKLSKAESTRLYQSEQGIEISKTSIYLNTVRCHYNTVNFLQTFHKRHPRACPLRWDIGSLLCVQIQIYILPQSLQWCVQYNVILDCVITAPNCLSVKYYPDLHSITEFDLLEKYHNLDLSHDIKSKTSRWNA